MLVFFLLNYYMVEFMCLLLCSLCTVKLFDRLVTTCVLATDGNSDLIGNMQELAQCQGTKCLVIYHHCM